MNVEKAREILSPYTADNDAFHWEHPSDYWGHSPDGDYVLYSRSRDSEILHNTNYELILQELLDISDPDKEEMEAYGDCVYDFRANHWAVGWVEYIILRYNSPDVVIIRAAEIVEALEDYPVVDEMAYSDAQTEAMNDYWTQASLSDRVEWCRDAGASIFASRGGIPEQVYNEMASREMFN